MKSLEENWFPMKVCGDSFVMSVQFEKSGRGLCLGLLNFFSKCKSNLSVQKGVFYQNPTPTITNLEKEQVMEKDRTLKSQHEICSRLSRLFLAG